MNIVLVEPEIPPNTGNIARLCLATGTMLHLVEPLGFSLEEKHLRRAGMDYWHECDVTIWKTFEEFVTWRGNQGRMYFLTTKADRPYWDARFGVDDTLVFGRETRGLPKSLLDRHREDCLRIPMVGTARSLNLATSAGIVLYEALRQNSATLLQADCRLDRT